MLLQLWFAYAKDKNNYEIANRYPVAKGLFLI